MVNYCKFTHVHCVAQIPKPDIRNASDTLWMYYIVPSPSWEFDGGIIVCVDAIAEWSSFAIL